MNFYLNGSGASSQASWGFNPHEERCPCGCGGFVCPDCLACKCDCKDDDPFEIDYFLPEFPPQSLDSHVYDYVWERGIFLCLGCMLPWEGHRLPEACTCAFQKAIADSVEQHGAVRRLEEHYKGAYEMEYGILYYPLYEVADQWYDDDEEEEEEEEEDDDGYESIEDDDEEDEEDEDNEDN
jgi:hypothetical protein